MRVVLMDPSSGALRWRLSNGGYEEYTPSGAPLSKVVDYRDWFVGRSGHLPFAMVGGNV